MHRSAISCILDLDGSLSTKSPEKSSEKSQGRSGPVFEAYPVELRPVLTRHRLRRRRHRNAASVLTGDALALGFSAMRPVPAAATTSSQAASYDATRSILTNPRHPAPRHAAPANPERRIAETLHPSARPAPAPGTDSPQPRHAPSQPGRHARPPGPTTGYPSAHAAHSNSTTTTGYSGLPPPHPQPP